MTVCVRLCSTWKIPRYWDEDNFAVNDVGACFEAICSRNEIYLMTVQEVERLGLRYVDFLARV